MIPDICFFCCNYEPDPNVGFCLLTPHPNVTNYTCNCFDPDYWYHGDLFVNCPDCVFALDHMFCLKSHCNISQNSCPDFCDCFV